MKKTNKVMAWWLVCIVWVWYSIYYSSTYGIQNPTPIDWQCGTLALVSTGTNNIHPNISSNFYCQEGDTDSIQYNSWVSAKYRSWMCKWQYWGSSAVCQYNIVTSPTITNGSCWLATNQSFENTLNSYWSIYNNNNNNFLWRLCQNWSTNLLPISFTENALGWTWLCPGQTSSCTANRYQNASCGLSANTGHSTIPSNNLCSPGTIAWPITFDNQTQLRGRTCNGNWWANTSVCTAWLNGPNNFSPLCNTNLIETPTSIYPYNHITGFPGSNGCIYGTLTNRQISLGWTGTRQCINNGQTSSTCWNIQVINSNNTNETCNDMVNNKSFDSLYELWQNNLCSNWSAPSSFKTMNDRRRWTCGLQSCEALMTTQSMCGWATKQPWRSYPTDGVCVEWIASTIKQSNTEWWWICTTNLNNIQRFENTICTNASCLLNVLDFYNGRTAVCSAPRIVDGACKRQTQINPNGYSSPDEVLQAWLCDSGIPDTLIPSQDSISKKWKWKCKASWWLGVDSPTCYANVRLPVLPVLYIPQITNGSITSVIAYLTGFSQTYINFTNPINQSYRLFTQNGSFLFQYQDRAGNTGSTLAVVDTIQNNIPTATIVYSPSVPTSWSVIVSLTWFNRPQVPIITFTGACLNNWSCIKNNSVHPYLFNVTYNQNSTGLFTLTDSAGISNTIAVAVTNIDRTPPTATIQYSNPNPTNTGVVATIINPSEAITIINNNGQSWYTFNNNGSFWFIIMDKAGNTSTINAAVNRISKSAPTARVIYSTTWATQNNIIATLTDFSVSGTVVTNNNGQISYIFTHNTEFIFLLKDPAGNIWSVVAKTTTIDKPITQDLIWDYTSKLCDQRTPTPVDTQWQIYNYHIQTVINNCIMKSIQWKNNYRYFYPRKWITRGEFITAIGRMIKLTTQYSWSIVNSLSPNYIQTSFNAIDESTIGEADIWWLLIYSPLYKNNTKRQTNMKQTISSTEAQAILKRALTIMNNTTDLRYLIKNKGNLTKSQAAYAIGTIVSQYTTTALGNNHVLLQAVNDKLSSMTDPSQKRIFVVNLIKKIQKTSTKSLARLGVHPDIIIQDLKSIALWTSITRKYPEIIDLQTTIDSLIRANKTPTLPINNSDKTYNNNFFNFWSDL